MKNKMLSFDEFWKMLSDKGYQYGFDAADNAYFGYKLAFELEQDAIEAAKFCPLCKKHWDEHDFGVPAPICP
jgi:hypothetical protein